MNKKIRVVTIEFLIALFFIFNISNVVAADYFPLSVENTWSYHPSYGDNGDRVDTIIGKEIVNGIHTYIWNRQEAPDDNYNEKRWIAKTNAEVKFYKLWANFGPDPALILNPPWLIIKSEPKVDDTWIQELDIGNVHYKVTYLIESINDIITVPAGTFRNCVRIRQLSESTENSQTDYEYKKHWYAPNIGPIIYREYADSWQTVQINQELISYSIKKSMPQVPILLLTK